MSDRPSPPSPAAEATGWLFVTAVIAAAVVATMQIGKVPPALPLIREEFGLGMVAGGWVASMITLTGALTGIAAGVVGDRLGHRRVVIAGLVCLAVGSFAGGAAPSGVTLLLTRFFEGVGHTAIVVAGTPLVFRATRAADQRLALGIWSAFFPMGIGSMMALSPIFLESFGWRAMWFANGALLVVFLLLFVGVAPASYTAASAAMPAARQTWRDVRVAITRPGPWLLSVMILLLSIATFSVMAWLPTYLAEGLGYSPSAAALITAAIVATLIPANILGSWVLHWNIRRWHVLAAGALGIALFPLGIFAAGVPDILRFASTIAFTLIAGLIPGAVFSGVLRHAPTAEQTGAVTGVIVQGSNLGLLFGPPVLAAVVVRLGGWQASPWLFLIVGGLSLCTAYAIGRIEARP